MTLRKKATTDLAQWATGGAKTSKPGPGAATTRTRTRGGGGGGGGAAAKAKGLSNTQADAVSTMQKLMSDLSLQIQKNPEGIAKKVDGFDANTLKRLAESWGRTGRGRLTPADGVWGPNTKGSLERIKQFVADAKISGVMIQVGDGARPYAEMEDAEITKMARGNIANLARLFSVLGLQSSVSIDTGRGGIVVDMIPRDLTDDSATSNTPLTDFRGDDGHYRTSANI